MEPTNEEKRVLLHNTDKLTIPSEVTVDVPVESLNLNWREQDLPERERTKHIHRLHPYLGKYIPQLVEIFLRKYFVPGQTVLDPFVGSGTTLVQANELGMNAIGYDISAFNALLCRAKTARYDLEQVHFEVLDIFNRVRELTQNNLGDLPLFSHLESKQTDPQTNSDYLQQWFAPQSLKELLTYRDCIAEGNYRYVDLLKVILSRSARSARLTTHFDLDFPKKPQTEPYWCYKHSRTCQPTQDAFKFLKRYSHDTLRRVEAFAQVRSDAQVTIHHANSQYADFPPVDGIITSPPYVGLIDYHEQHRYAYELLGLEDKRLDEIGPAASGTSQRAKSKYQLQITEVFKRAVQAIPSGGYMIVVAADKADLYGNIAKTIGVEVEHIVQRHVNRRTGRRAGEFYESIFIWRIS